MKKLLALGALIAAIAAATAHAQVVPAPPGTAAMVCANNASVPSPISGQFFYVQCDSNGKLITSGTGGSIALGTAVNSFGGLQFAIAPAGLGNPAGSMTGYVVGDNITLQCPGVTFAVSPVIGVSAVSAGAVTGSVTANVGSTNNAVPSGSITCTQASTSGVGTGYQAVVKFGLIASYVQPASLGTGGSANNGNFLLNIGSNDSNPAGALAGPENTFLGDKSGTAFTGNSGFNTAVGHNACGGGGNATFAGNSNSCFGTDAGRNILSPVGSTVFVGANAGKNLQSGGRSTFVGVSAASNNNSNSAGAMTGVNQTVVGYQAGIALTSGNGNTLFGTSVGSAITTGSGNVMIAAVGSGTPTDNCANGNESNVLAICMGAGRVITGTGGATPATSNVAAAGTLQTVQSYSAAGTAIPTCTTALKGARAFVTDATAITFLAPYVSGSANFAPVICDGSSWVVGG